MIYILTYLINLFKSSSCYKTLFIEKWKCITIINLIEKCNHDIHDSLLKMWMSVQPVMEAVIKFVSMWVEVANVNATLVFGLVLTWHPALVRSLIITINLLSKLTFSSSVSKTMFDPHPITHILIFLQMI